MLWCLDCCCEVCASGETAVRLFRRAQAAGDPFGAVILDLMAVDDLRGLRTARELRRINPAIRLIFCSGALEAAPPEVWDEFGGMENCALGKPFKFERLEKLLGGRR